jgi:hypothetical protein
MRPPPSIRAQSQLRQYSYTNLRAPADGGGRYLDGSTARGQAGTSPSRSARPRPGGTSPGRVCHFKSDYIHLNVLNNSYNRMIVSLSTFSGDGNLKITDSPMARRYLENLTDPACAPHHPRDHDPHEELFFGPSGPRNICDCKSLRRIFPGPRTR